MKKVRIKWGESYQICQLAIFVVLALHVVLLILTEAPTGDLTEYLSLLCKENQMKGAEGIQMAVPCVLRQSQ